MKAEIRLVLLVAGILCTSALPQNHPHPANKALSSKELTPSEHRSGPHGLEGWTLEGPIPDTPDAKYPFALVIARNNKAVRRIEGDPFVWKWMFVDDGRQVAYESGPLHFGMTCILADIETGRQLSTYDCYRELPPDAPDWVEALESAP